MKIGIDCRLWSESGVGRYIRNLVGQLQILDKKNDYVLFVLSKNRGEILRNVSNDNFRIVESDIRWHTIEEQLRLPQVINRENLDLMHFPYISVPIFYNKPFVVTIHDIIPLHFATGDASTLSLPLYKLKLLGYRLIIFAAAKKAKKIIAVSNATKDEIIEHLGVPKDKVVVTYEGIDEKITNPKSQIPNNPQNTKYKILNTKYFLYVGNAYPHKNLDRLLEAFSTICHPERSEGSPDALYSASWDSSVAGRPQNDIKLLLVGKEDFFYKRLKEKVRNMRLEKSVIFEGEVSDEELGSLYKNAKALIMPSLMEGFGLPALEAMVNKCLVLASDITSLREVCGDAAIHFDPYSIKDIAQKMRDVYLNDIYHLSVKKEKGYERVEMFSWEKMGRETLKIYESCVSL